MKGFIIKRTQMDFFVVFDRDKTGKQLPYLLDTDPLQFTDSRDDAKIFNDGDIAEMFVNTFATSKVLVFCAEELTEAELFLMKLKRGDI